MGKLPIIAIVGRPNVGKSSLLNALTGKRISIVQDQPGVTRDRVSMPLRLGDRFVEMIDTGGYGFVDPDQLTEHIKHQVELAIASADLVVFLVDCQAGRTSADEQIASMLRRKGIKTILVANKSDSEKSETALGDFARLGLGTPIGVSAMNDRNIDLLQNTIAKNVDLTDAPTEIPPPQMHIAIVGKRNAGKSTLVNSIAKVYEGDGERVIVSEVPGTTRDSIDVAIEKDGQRLIVIDTAGVRKKRHMVTNDIEFYSYHRAQRSVRRADVVLLLIDATEPISEPDKKLAQYIADEFKPVILVVNKWDRAKDILHEQNKKGEAEVDDREMMEQYRKYLDAELRHVSYAPIAFITAKEGKNVQGVLDLCGNLFRQANERVTTGRLNTVVRDILQQRVISTPSGRRARIYYATQTDVAPPTIVLFVNKPDYFDETYQRFMINRFRETLPFAEVPMRLIIRPRGQRAVGEEEIDEVQDRNKSRSGAPSRQKREPAKNKKTRGGRGKRPPRNARPKNSSRPARAKR